MLSSNISLVYQWLTKLLFIHIRANMIYFLWIAGIKECFGEAGRIDKMISAEFCDPSNQ
jgi:hypothetical protein